MRRFLLLAALLAVAACTLAAPPAAAPAGPLYFDLAGPSAVAPGATAAFNVTASGGPSGNVTYTVTYYIEGTNTSGGSPLSSSPGRTSGNRTTLEINMTAPSQEQTVTLVVTLDATAEGGAAQNVTRNFSITVVKPIVLTATFHNGGTTTAVNITVRWYVDNVLVGTSFIKQIAANGDATATFNYLPVGLAAGQHTVQAQADLDHDNVIDPSKGEVVTSTIFYNQTSEPAVGWTVLLGVGVFIPVFLGVVALRRRGQR